MVDTKTTIHRDVHSSAQFRVSRIYMLLDCLRKLDHMENTHTNINIDINTNMGKTCQFFYRYKTVTSGFSYDLFALMARTQIPFTPLQP